MKTRIIGTIFVLTMLVALFMLTEGNTQGSSSAVQSQPVPSNSDNDFKNLKINP